MAEPLSSLGQVFSYPMLHTSYGNENRDMYDTQPPSAWADTQTTLQSSQNPHQ